MAAADAAAELLRRRLDAWRDVWRRVGSGARAPTDDEVTACAEWFPALVAAWRRDGTEPLGLRMVARWLFHTGHVALDVLTDAEIFGLVTTRMYCDGCKEVTPHLPGEGACVRCHDVPKLRHAVAHWRRHLTATLTPETRDRVERWLARDVNRLADAEQYAAAVAADENTEPWGHA